MLAYVLALMVGFGSLAIYMAAFFFPEVHRKNDFIWSGLGLFYAWVLWICAGRVTGGLLLGQAASVALLGWSVTQNLSLRRQLTPRSQQTEIPSTKEVINTVQEKVSSLSLKQRFSQLGKQVGGSATAAKSRLQQIGDQRQSQGNTNPKVEIIDKRTSIPEPTQPLATDVLEVLPKPPAPEVQPSGESVLNAQIGESAAISTEDEIQPTLTEEEAIALAVENTLAEATPETRQEPMRPHPPDPELVEAAIRDAEEKHQEASPPEIEQSENPSPG